MNKIKAVLIEVRADQNEESIRASLLTKASKEQKPDRRQPKAAVAGTDEHKGSKAAKAKPKAKAKSSEKGDKGPNPKKETGPKGKDDEDKGKGKRKETKDPNLKAKSKPTIACLFYPKGNCTCGDSCPFLHEPKAAAKPKAAAPSKTTVAAVIGSAGVSGASASNVAQCSSDVLFRRTLKRSSRSMIKSFFAAIIKPIVTLSSCIVGVTEPQGAATQATLCAGFGVVVKDAFPCMPAILSTGTALYSQSSRQVSHELEWIADSGADRDLGCDRAFAQQRFSKEMVNQNRIGVSPTKFETGNGSYTSDSCVQLTGNHFWGGSVQHDGRLPTCAFNGTDCCVGKALLDTRSVAIFR